MTNEGAQKIAKQRHYLLEWVMGFEKPYRVWTDTNGSEKNSEMVGEGKTWKSAFADAEKNK